MPRPPIVRMRVMTEIASPRPRLIKRHGAVVRITHWINALCLGLLLMSGLQIFNAHPALYIGQTFHVQDAAFRDRLP